MSAAYVVSVESVSHAYRQGLALDDVSVSIPAGQRIGLIGPDGVGKSSLLALIAGVRDIQQGSVSVLQSDMRKTAQRQQICSRIAYMPQGLGKNLYMTLTVYENILFFARLFGLDKQQQSVRINMLLQSTGLAPFRDRPAGKLSGGMKQKLGLCCALIHSPDLLILDEPTTGVDPLSRRQFWQLIDKLRAQQPTMSVIIATAYMDEATGFDWLIAMNDGKVLATGSPAELMQQTQTDDLDAAFIQLLPQHKKQGHQSVVVPPRQDDHQGRVAIQASGLSKRFANFTAVDDVSFTIEQGEIFGFLGSNGCGKTTTMKMLTGLLPVSAGEARLFDQPVNAHDMAMRQRVGFMSQTFSLYEELSVMQNLNLHARLYQLNEAVRQKRIPQLLAEFELDRYQQTQVSHLPLGIRQRLSLAVAVIHQPEILILDEPTSGVDPIARDQFWQLLIGLSRDRGVTIFVSTHFMNEAERCDRIALMHAGKVLATGTPEALCEAKNTDSLEDSFIAYLQAQLPESDTDSEITPADIATTIQSKSNNRHFSLSRLLAYSLRETLEIKRDPIRLTFAFLGTVILMFVLGYGISMDVDDINFAVLDRDQSPESRDYIRNMDGSTFFTEKAPLYDDAEMDRRMRSGDISLAVEIPPDYGKQLRQGRQPAVSFWVDGAMPFRAETIKGYAQAMHYHYISELMQRMTGNAVALSPVSVVSRYRYNPDVKSLPAMVPAVLPLILLMISAMLTALSVVREKELGSITNFYATPVKRIEFLLGKQLPYIVIGSINFLFLVWMALVVFDVPVKGSLPVLALGAMVYIIFATGFGLLMSAFTKTQIAAIFGTMVATMIPTVNYAGLVNPVSSLEGAGRVVGEMLPATYFLLISRGAFTKGLFFPELAQFFWPILLAIVVVTIMSVLLLRKQEK